MLHAYVDLCEEVRNLLHVHTGYILYLSGGPKKAQG